MKFTKLSCVKNISSLDSLNLFKHLGKKSYVKDYTEMGSSTCGVLAHSLLPCCWITHGWYPKDRHTCPGFTKKSYVAVVSPKKSHE
jgi:hypothetical protein